MNGSDQDHPPDCGCDRCNRLVFALEGPAELEEDLDSMEDEDQPFFWNRRR